MATNDDNLLPGVTIIHYLEPGSTDNQGYQGEVPWYFYTQEENRWYDNFNSGGGGSDEPPADDTEPLEPAAPPPTSELPPPLPSSPPTPAAPVTPFQGPVPAPSPPPTPPPSPPPVAAPSSMPPSHSYEIPKPGLLTTARFYLEKFLKAIGVPARNVIPRMPTPITFIGEALLIGDEVADATLYGQGAKDMPQRIPAVDYFADTYTTLEEQTIWAPTLSNRSFESPFIAMPMPTPQLTTEPYTAWQPLFETSSPMPMEATPQPYSVPMDSPTAAPLSTPLELSPMPEPLVTTTPLVAAPSAPIQPMIGAPSPLTPTAANPTIPGFAPFNPQPMPAPFTPTASAQCPPCTKEKEKEKKKEKKKPRAICYRGTYIERSRGLIKHKRERVQCQ